ncbi:thioredoxin-disulfide reductase, partial [human gut metagenome]
MVLATGADPRTLGVAGEAELVGRGVAYCAACDGMFYKDKTVVVVGGGNSAATDALLLSRVAKKGDPRPPQRHPAGHQDL